MSLEVIKNLKKEIEELKEKINSSEGVVDTIKAIEAKVAEMDRKKEFGISGEVSKDQVKAAEEKAIALKIKSAILKRPINSFKEFKDVATIIEKAIKPSDIDAWLDTKFSNRIIDLAELELKVAKLFPEFKVPKNVDILAIPQKTGRTTAYLIQPAQDAIESAITAGRVEFKPVKLMTLVTLASETENEAVISAIMDVIQQEIGASLGRGIENAIINGDTTGAINNNPPATDVTNAFDGLRKYGSAHKVDNGGVAITKDSILKARTAMALYGIDPNEVVMIVNPTVYYQMLSIPELMTVDKFGTNATITKGALAKIFGMDIIVSEYIPNALDSDGNVNADDTQNTKTAALLVSKKGFARAMRGNVEIAKDINIVSDTNLLTAKTYVDFKKIVVEDTVASYIVNIANS